MALSTTVFLCLSVDGEYEHFIEFRATPEPQPVRLPNPDPVDESPFVGAIPRSVCEEIELWPKSTSGISGEQINDILHVRSMP